MTRIVLGIHDKAGPVLIRTSEGTGKSSSQDTAVLGSMVTYADGIGLQFSSVATDDFTIGFQRYSAGNVVNRQSDTDMSRCCLQSFPKFTLHVDHNQQAAQRGHNTAVSAGK